MEFQLDMLLSEAALPWIYSIGLIILGFVLILLEVFIIPGINIFGLVGFGTVGVGILFAYRNLGPGPALMIGVIGVGGTALLLWLLVRNQAWHRMVHDGRADRASGYNSSEQDMQALRGAIGTALTTLRPSGRAQFDERIVDVVSDGGFIAHGTSIEVLEVHGNRIVVQERAD